MRKFVLLFAFVGAGLGLSMLSGCSQETGSSASFDSVYNNSFATSCSNCHFAGAPANRSNIDASTADSLYNSLVNVSVQSPANPSQCQTVRRVDSGSSASSYLMGVLSASYNSNNFAGVSGCQPNTAHLGYVNLSSSEISAIAAWIDAGASR